MASIRQRGQSWAVLFNHERKQRSKTFASKSDALKFRAVVDAAGPQAALELLDNSSAGKMTVDELAQQWLAWKKPRMTVEGHRDYERQYAKWIKPTFGWRVAEMVNEGEVQDWVDNVLAVHLGGKSVAGKHALLHGIYAWGTAKARGLVAHNPCKETELPPREKAQLRGFSIPELHALLTAAQQSDMPDAGDVIAVMAGTGWRPGEALAPAAGDAEVSNEMAYLTMNQVFRRSEGIVRGGKTVAAVRRLRVLGEGSRVVQRRVVGRGFNDLLFTNPTTGGPWNPNAFRRNYWVPIVEAANLDHRGPTPYWLRHTHVALCVAAGMTLPEIQRRVGHKSISTTIDVYGRMIDGMTDEVADNLEALLDPSTSAAIVQGQVVSD